jgi:hypothetical protein
MNCGKAYARAHPKKIEFLCQSIPAILKQCAHLSLAEELLDLVAPLLGLHKGMDFVEGPESICQIEVKAFYMESTL